MKRISLITAASVLLCCTSAWSGSRKTEAPPKVNVLFLIGGGVHDHKGLAPILKKDLEDTGRFNVTITEDLNRLITLPKERPDVLLQYTTRLELSPEQEKGLTDYVAAGGGWVGIHSASDSFRNSDAYWKMVGGRFSGHGHGTFTVHYTASRHEAVRGLSDFEITDEDYNHDFHKDARIIVLARRPKDGAPAVWVQYYGKGRVFYTGLGHGKPAWENPGFKALVIRGVTWAAGRPPEFLESRAGCAAK